MASWIDKPSSWKVFIIEEFKRFGAIVGSQEYVIYWV